MVSDPQSSTISSWEDVFLNERPRLLRLITRRLGGQEGAEDLLQEVALAAQTAVNRPDHPAELVRWMQTVTVNKIQDHWRKHHRRAALADEVSEAEWTVPSGTPLDGILLSEQRQGLQRAIEALPDDTRALLRAKYLDGQTYAEMAARWDCTEKSLEYRLAKAREQLRVLLLQNDE